MKRPRYTRRILGPALFLALVPGASGQQPPADAAPKPAPQKPATKGEAALSSAPDQPKWDPLRAEKDLEVGKYYMRKGDVDAAIDRFTDAIDARPGYAIPFRYLAEAQERKGQKADAIRSYARYLDLYPHAEDSDKVKKKIEKLRLDVAKDERKSAS